MEKTVELGRVVRANAGREKGHLFLIVGIISEDYVLIADGDKRKLSAPKKKKLRHLDFKPEVMAGIANKILEEKKVFDAEIKSALYALKQSEGQTKGDLELV